MSQYIVSALKYRPLTFNSVVGQRALTATLKNAIASKKLAHAYLFCGPRGVGKTTCARIFGKTINCLNPTTDGEACNECESCVAFNESRSFNIHELDAASNNSVDDIRSLIEQVRIPPQIGKYKVYIIDEVHMLSQQAFNAFLKTLEEPPRHAIFVLATTEKHKILPTILSRCQIYDFSRITIKDIVEHLQYVADSESVKAEPEALNILAQKADGGMRDALSIFDQVVSFTGGNITYKAVIENLNVLDYEYYFSLTEAILNGDVTKGLLILNDILSKGFDGHNVITGIATHFRDLLLCKDPQTASLFEVGEALQKRYIEIAQKCNTPFLYEAIGLVNEADLNYRLSRNKRLLADLTIIRLCQLSTPNGLENEKKNKVIQPIFSEKKAPASQPESKPSSQPIKQSSAPLNKTVNSFTPKPKTSPTPSNTTPSIGGLGISLSALNKKQEKIEEKIEEIQDNWAERFTQEQLIAAWNDYADQIQVEHHLRNSMLNCQPSLLNDTTFEVVVNNPMQLQKLQEESIRILNALKIRLKNTSLQMQVRVTETNEKKLAYTPIERFNLMAEENEALLKLKDEFGLELS